MEYSRHTEERPAAVVLELHRPDVTGVFHASKECGMVINIKPSRFNVSSPDESPDARVCQWDKRLHYWSH